MLKKNTDDYSLASEFPALRLVKTGRTVRAAARITFVSLMFSIAAVFLVPWRQTAHGTGNVLALDPQLRPQVVRSQTKGIVNWVKEDLREGSYVEEGEVLLRVAPFAADAVGQIDRQVQAVNDKLEQARQSLDVAKMNAERQVVSGESLLQSLNQDLAAAKQKWEQAISKLSANRAELRDKINQRNIARQLVHPDIGLETQESLYTKERAVEAMEQKVAEAEQAAAEQQNLFEAKQSELSAKTEDIFIKNRQAEQKVLEEAQKVNTIFKELQDIENKRGELERLEVFAPRSGFIQQWNGLQGSDVIKEGEQLFVLVPDVEEMAVELQVRGIDMPLIREGFPVRLQFEGWPAVQAVGWPSVAVGTFGGKVNRISPTDDGKGRFTLVIVPDKHFAAEKDWPDGRYLRQGVRANGWVLLNEVPLGFEIWRQLNGFPPVITDKDVADKEKGSKIKLPKP
jgi:multidrug resistance efflux pump